MKGTDYFQGRKIRQIQQGPRIIRYIADQLVVRLKPQFRNVATIRNEILNMMPDDSFLEHDFDRLGIGVYHLPPTADPLEMARRVKMLDAVEFAEPNFVESNG